MKLSEEMEQNLETCSFALRADNKARRNRVEEDIEIIKQLPPVTPKQRTGKWIPRDGRYYCDRCGGIAPKGIRWDFCPNCGAKMTEGDTE